MNDILKNFSFYGQDIYAEGAVDEIVDIMEQFSMVVRGKDKAITRRKKINPRYQSDD